MLSNLSFNNAKTHASFLGNNSTGVNNNSSNKNVSSSIKSDIQNNKMTYVSAGIALAALGAAGIATHNMAKAKKALQKELSQEFGRKLKESSDGFNEALNEMKGSVEGANNRINEVRGSVNSANNKINEIKGSVEGVDKKVDSKTEFIDKYVRANEEKINDLRNDVNSQNGQISVLKDQVNLKNGSLIECKDTEANGAHFQLADVVSKIWGDARTEYENTLKSESAKRMLGLGKPLEKVPENGMIRIPTSEIKPYSSTGGLAAVPKEIAENLAKMVAGRQKMQIVLDTPLYKGQVSKSITYGENNQKTVKQVFYDLKYDKEKDIYHYRKQEFTDGKLKKNTNLSDLKLIDQMDVPIVTENNSTIEHVKIFMGEQKIEMKHNNPEKYFTQDVKDNMKKTFDQKRALFNDKNAFGKEVFLDKVKDGNDIVEKKYIAYSTDNLEVREYEDGTRKAFAKVKAVFYDHPKFKLDTPANENADIYTKRALNAGETERFTYFSKFFYEHLANNDSSKVPMRADLIIGNDWHTGPISAMVRQLTTARKAYSEISPEKAEQLQNIPIVTILHNATLDGGANHSHAKLLNVMFGTHAKEIVENSHMPNLQIMDADKKNVLVQGLPGHLHHGLLNSTDIAPQMMATAYSDYIIPVSKGYEKEITKQSVYGGPRTQLFEFRARTGRNSSSLQDLKYIAKENGLNPDDVKEVKPTLIGITNGSDKDSNTLTELKAFELSKALGLISKDAKMKEVKVPFKILNEGDDVLEWHNHNKKVYLDVIKRDLDSAKAGKENSMSIEMLQDTDLTGVTEKTPVFVSAGRLVDQKGLDILGESIKNFYQKFKGTDYPVFYIQGLGTDPAYKNMLLDAKKEVAKTNPDAAKRIIVANLFDEPGRFDGARLISDFSLMPSWYEPCGLVHKEISPFSGAIGIVNRTGGLIDGLKEGKNVIVSEFSPYRNDIEKNGQNFADAMLKAVEIQKDDNKFRSMMTDMMKEDFSWAKKDGPIYEYTKIFKDMNVLTPEVADTQLI